jgi:diguanylate cyclase (GGDEF)-like protein/PAS domain S-box-containing protein
VTDRASDLEGENRRLREENAWLRSVLRYAGDILICTDLHGRLTEWSGGAEKILGWTKEEVLGRSVYEVYVDPETPRELTRKLRERPGEPLLDQDVQVRRKDGRKIWLSLSLADLLDGAGRRIGRVGVSKDVTERKRLERELRRLSVTDKLTGLHNQAHFFERLEIEKERAVRLAHGLALVLFDLDGFKEYNDAQGHEAGDRVLRFVGGVVMGSIRKEVDSGYRYGGDEFCCLLPGSDVTGAVTFAERLRQGIESGEAGQRITASIGICVHDPTDRGLQIVKSADQSMYRAKRAGGNRICVHGRDEQWRAGMPIGGAATAPVPKTLALK